MRASAHAKINLGLVVGPRRENGRHELVTVLQAVELADELSVELADALDVTGFAEDTIVSAALSALGRAVGTEPGWRVHIEKHIPVAAGLGGGSSDAATALRIANTMLGTQLADDELGRLAATVGADVPFFLREGSQLATGDGTELRPATLPTDYHVLLVVPHDVVKESTASVYDAFDRRSGEAGFADRAAEFRRALESVARPRDLATLPRNDLASSPIAAELADAGAFRADVSGAGPTVYALFERADDAARAAALVATHGQTFVTRPLRAGLAGVAR
jgi:4-diphosphocytidyl-2-C-methyl-D-erythritol kinase